MRACTMANGAVFFAPDEIERKTNAVSYAEIAAAEPAPEKTGRRFFLFGKNRKAAQPLPEAAGNRERRAV